MSDQRRKLLIGAAIPVGLLVLLYLVWGVAALVGGDQVARNVTVRDIPLGGLDADDVRAVAGDLDAELADTPAAIVVGDETIGTDLHTMGVRIDADRLVTDALDARRDGSPLLRPFSWIGTFFSDHQIEAEVVVDDELAEQSGREIIQNGLAEPTEPTIDVTPAGATVTPGLDGTTIDHTALPEAVRDALAGGAPYRIVAVPLPLPPDTETAAFEAVATEINDATAEPVEISVLGQTAIVEPGELRAWIELDDSTVPPTWAFDDDDVIDDLRPRFSGLGEEAQQARFEVVDGEPIIIPANETVVCCAEGSGEIIRAALLGPAPTPAAGDDDGGDDDEGSDDGPALRSIELEPATSGSDEGVAELEALGIIEEVATFTTNHNCCEGRVQNIQRMAAIVQGYVVRPGEVFDLNEIVGRRTSENGFVAAGAIAEGVLEPQIGGGVSQFTTTMFNAAFFAGMEFVEYQSHSLYFSRYPRGREATISFPKPDFIVRNTSPYGILVWPTWTDTSITVTLYSTEWVEVEDVGRSESAQGACTRVTTTREITYPNGDVVRDTVFAVYRPGEGLDCNGNPTRPDLTTTTTEGETTTTVEGETTTTIAGDTTTTTTATTAPPSSTTTTTAPPASSTTTTTAAGG